MPDIPVIDTEVQMTTNNYDSVPNVSWWVGAIFIGEILCALTCILIVVLKAAGVG